MSNNSADGDASKFSEQISTLPLPYNKNKGSTLTAFRRGSIEFCPTGSAGELLKKADANKTRLSVLTAVAAVLTRYGARRHLVLGVGGGRAEPFKIRCLTIPVDLNMTLVQLKAAIQLADEESLTIINSRENLSTLEDQRSQKFPHVLVLAPHEVFESGPSVDLTIRFSPRERIFLKAWFNAWLLDEPRIETLLSHVATVMECISNGAPGCLSSLDYLGSDEKKYLCRVFNDTLDTKIEDVTVNRLFSRAVIQFGSETAIVGSQRSWRYDELEARANQIANFLLNLRVRPQDRIGLCLLPSPDQIIWLLAVMKTGAVVVPLDWTFPDKRIKAMCSTGMLKIILTEDNLLNRLPRDVPLIPIESVEDELVQFEISPPKERAQPDTPVYMLFTSGTTGDPKGVIMHHRGLANLLQWQAHQTPVAGTRTLNRTSLAFDVSFQEILSTLCFGGTLVVSTDEERSDVSDLHNVVKRQNIQRIFLPPVALQQMAESARDESSNIDSLKYVIVAGEQLIVTPPIIALFRNLDAKLINQYGPTETHVATSFMLDTSPLRWPQTPSIGRPISNMKIYIADEYNQLLPRGIIGEMLIGGVGVSEGYFGRLDLTSTSFRRVRFSLDQDEVVYCSGDLGRILASGELEFCGRMDDQVKLRGYRIELGDIEAHASNIQGIRQSAAKLWSLQGDCYIALYLVADMKLLVQRWQLDQGDLIPGLSELAHFFREELKESLPEHMLPSIHAISFVEQFPFTPTGKIDREQFRPPLADSRSNIDAHGVTELVRRLWLKHLHIPSVKDGDDFLELGGHSLVAIQVVSEVNELLGTAVPLATLLRGKTFEDFITTIKALNEASTEWTDQRGQNFPGVTSIMADSELPEIVLPDGAVLASVVPEEAKYLWRDVIELNTYLRNGIKLTAGAVVIDVGANIGLFAHHVLNTYPESRVIALEPATPLFRALSKNLSSFGTRAEILPFGCGDANRDNVQFCYYPLVPGMSSFFPNSKKDFGLFKSIVHNALIKPLENISDDENLVNDSAFAGKSMRCSVRRLDSIISDYNINSIDLLKIDVQHGEDRVLSGISDRNWARIKQVVLEVQDGDGAIETIEAFLMKKSFKVHEQQILEIHRNTDVYFIYATRNLAS